MSLHLVYLMGFSYDSNILLISISNRFWRILFLILIFYYLFLNIKFSLISSQNSVFILSASQWVTSVQSISDKPWIIYLQIKVTNFCNKLLTWFTGFYFSIKVLLGLEGRIDFSIIYLNDIFNIDDLTISGSSTCNGNVYR